MASKTELNQRIQELEDAQGTAVVGEITHFVLGVVAGGAASVVVYMLVQLGG